MLKTLQDMVCNSEEKWVCCKNEGKIRFVSSFLSNSNDDLIILSVIPPVTRERILTLGLSRAEKCSTSCRGVVPGPVGGWSPAVMMNTLGVRTGPGGGCVSPQGCSWLTPAGSPVGSVASSLRRTRSDRSRQLSVLPSPHHSI